MKRVIVGLLGVLALLGVVQAVPHRAGAATTQFTLFDAPLVHTATKYAQPSSTSGPTNWLSPVNYRDGRAYLRFEVTSKPSDLPLAVQLCFWRDDYTKETCSSQHNFSTVGVHWIDLGRPGSWWKLGGTWDFTQPFSPARLMIKDPSRGELFMTGSCGTYCYTGPEDVAAHVPVRVNASVVVVAKGAVLAPPSTWAGCPSTWSTGCSGSTNAAPVANAGPDITTAVAGAAVPLPGSVSDDGLPVPPGRVTASWSVTSGPGQVGFDDAAALGATAVFSAPGSYVLELRASDGLLQATDTVRVTVAARAERGSAVLVASKATPVANDAPYVSWLRELGFAVTAMDDDQLSRPVLDGADLVVVSASVDAARIPAWIAAVDSPIISSKAAIAPKLGLAAKGKELTGLRKVQIGDATSPLAAGLTGSPTISSTTTTIAGIENLSPGVHVVAKSTSAASLVATVAVAEAGTALPTGAAPDARVGFFLGYPAPPVVNAAGRAMFDAAASWLTYEPAPPMPWWHDGWRFRLPLTMSAGAIRRADAVVEADVDLAPAGQAAGAAIAPASLRVVETDVAGTVTDEAVPFQFDPVDGFDGVTVGSGRLTVLAEGVTPIAATRHFHLYYDTVDAGHPPLGFPPMVAVNEGVDEGQPTFVVTAAGSSWHYQREGGGFSSLVDPDGNDWIGYGAAAGSVGQYRGIPNATYPQGHFHPGATTATTSLVAQGPLRVVVESVTDDGQWRTRWEFFPTYARVTMLQAADDYWLLYEGTPGGSLDAGDTVHRASGEVDGIETGWANDLPGREWVAFSDAASARTLYLSHPTPDTAIDSYRPMDGQMTVFGFGRNLTTGDFLTGTHQMVVGFVDSTTRSDIAAAAGAGAEPVVVTVGGVDERPAA